MARPQKTSFNLCSVPVAKYGSAYIHQKPDHRATLNYIHANRSHLNERWDKECQANGHPKTLRNYLSDTKKIVKAKTGRAMQKRAEEKVIGEAVVVIDEQTTMDDLQKLGKEMEERFGWTCVQIHIHKDEGYLGKRADDMKHREGKYNLHAHMFFVTTNLQTGKSWKMQVGDGSAMQDITAKVLNLTRGERKGLGKKKERLQALEYREKQIEESIAKKTEQSRKLDNSLSENAKEVSNLKADAARISADNQQTEKELETKQGQLKATINALSDAQKLADERDRTLSEIDDLQTLKITTELEIESNQRRIGEYEQIRQLIEKAEEAERMRYNEIVSRHTSRSILGNSTNWKAVAEEIGQELRTVKMAKPALTMSDRQELEDLRKKEREVKEMERDVHNERRRSIGAVWDTFVANCIAVVRNMTTAMMTTIWDWGMGNVTANKSRGTLLDGSEEFPGQIPHEQRMEALRRSQRPMKREVSQSVTEQQQRSRGMRR